MTVRPPRQRVLKQLPQKQVHLAAHFPGVDTTTVWADPRSRSQIEFSSFEHLARTAERGLFDFSFLADTRPSTSRTNSPAGSSRWTI